MNEVHARLLGEALERSQGRVACRRPLQTPARGHRAVRRNPSPLLCLYLLGHPSLETCRASIVLAADRWLT